jgi:hypothetical protein
MLPPFFTRCDVSSSIAVDFTLFGGTVVDSAHLGHVLLLQVDNDEQPQRIA